MTRYATKFSASALLCAAFLAGCGGGGSDAHAVDNGPAKCPTKVNVSAANAGQTVCVARGGTVTLGLKEKGWTAPTANAAGILNPAGVQSEPSSAGRIVSWTAAKVGHTTIMSQRPNCPSAAPGTVSCHSVQSFTLKVNVS